MYCCQYLRPYLENQKILETHISLQHYIDVTANMKQILRLVERFLSIKFLTTAFLLPLTIKQLLDFFKRSNKKSKTQRLFEICVVCGPGPNL